MFSIGPLMFPHEKCLCGSCRCQHAGGFGHSFTMLGCKRWTPATEDLDLPADHIVLPANYKVYGDLDPRERR
jgi:hypothetical protein